MPNWKFILGGALSMGLCATIHHINSHYAEQPDNKTNKNTETDTSGELRLKLVGLKLNIYRNSANITFEDPFLEKIEEIRMLTEEIGGVLRERDSDIEALAEEYYRMFRCESNEKPEDADHWRQEIRVKAAYMEILYGNRNDPSILSRELEALLKSRLDISEDIESIGHHAAEARYFERCLEEASGEGAYGLLDMYRDYRKARFARECEEAAILADAMGFEDEKFDTLSKCVPRNMTDYAQNLRDNLERFLYAVETSDEEGIVNSVKHINYEQQRGWVNACTAGRFRSGIYGREEARARCFSEIVRAYDRSGFVPFLDFELDEIERMSLVLNRNRAMDESACYLDAYLFGSGRHHFLPLYFEEPAGRQDYLNLCLSYTNFR